MSPVHFDNVHSSSDGRRLLPCHQLSKGARACLNGRFTKLCALPCDFRELIRATLEEIPKVASPQGTKGIDKPFEDLKRGKNRMDKNVKSWEDISGESSRGWELPEHVLKEMDKLFEEADKNSDGRLQRTELDGHADKIDFFFVNHGVPQSILNDDMSKEQLIVRFQRAKEVSHKMQSLSEVDITKVIACNLKGGSPEEPLQGLIDMSPGDLSTWCQDTLGPKIVELLAREKERLEKRRKNSKGGMRPDNENGKFAVSPGTLKATFGPIEDYYMGIIDKLGFPNVNIWTAMEEEHCNRDDSNDLFTPGNYKDFKTCPCKEWRAVTDKVEAAKLSAEKANGRRIMFYTELLENEKMAQDAKLLKEEVIALQLYSGPMFEKFNTVLRNFPRDKVKALKGNKYVTTIFLIVSGIIKLSQNMVLPSDRQVWRGLKNLQLPEEFLRKDKKGIRGGLELSMMSTSTDKKVAVQYAREGNPTLFRIEIGAIDRGADISFLSQYPHEKEIVFPPSSFIEVVGNVETDMLEDGTVVRVIPLKINANQMTKTIDQFLEQRKLLHTSMLHNFQMEITMNLAAQMESQKVKDRLEKDAFCAWNKHHVQLKDSILQECGEVVDRYKCVEYQEYNNDEFYSMAMKHALNMRTMATLKFSHWLDNASVQARLIKDQPLKRVERMVLASMHSQFMVAKSKGHDHDAQDFALSICMKRGCCVAAINERNDMGETPMLVEAASGSLTNLIYILAAGGKVNDKADDGLTPLMAAAFGGHLKCCELLVEKGAIIKEKDHDGHTCLYLACENGNLEVVRYFVEMQGDQGGHELMMMTRKDGVSCMMIAAKNGHVQVVKYLVEKGGEELLKLQRKSDNCGPLLMASLNGHLEVVKVLVKGSKDLISSADAKGITPLWIATSNGHGHVVEYLLEHTGSDELLFKKHAETLRSCLHIAAYNNHLDLCKTLLESGGELLMSIEDKDQATAFALACQQGHLGCAEFFLGHEHGGERLISQCLKDGISNLHLASQSGNLELIQRLSKGEHQRLLSVPDDFGTTCFYYSCMRGQLQSAMFVLDRAGEAMKYKSVDQGPNKGQHCLHAACGSGSLRLVEWLLEDPEVFKKLDVPDADGEYCFHKAVRKGHLDVCEYLLKKDHVKELYIKTVTPKKQTCLHVATESGNAMLLQAILDHVEEFYDSASADDVVDAMDGNGETCFTLACAQGLVDCVSVLYRRKDDEQAQANLLKSTGKNRRTPLLLASESGSTKLVQWLVEQPGGEELITSQDEQGASCLDLSSTKGHFDVFQFLVKKGSSRLLDVAGKKYLTPSEFAGDDNFQKYSDYLRRTVQEKAERNQFKSARGVIRIDEDSTAGR